MRALPALALLLGALLDAANAHVVPARAPAARGGSACPAACGVCPPPGFAGACCHGNLTCETQNWTPATCTPAYGTWCSAPVLPSPSPGPPPTPRPSPSPGPPPAPPGPRPPPRIVNYLIETSALSSALGSTHIILSFLEPSTATIPPPGDASWVKYGVAEFAARSASERAALLAALHADGALLMASLGGAAASHAVWSRYAPAAFGARAAQYVIELGLDGLDIDLEGWGNDPNGAAFLIALTAGAHGIFAAASGARNYTISHAPEMPDFWHGSLYATLLADAAAFAQIDFVNVQMYNQLQFPNVSYLFVDDIYPPAVDAPTCLESIARAVAALGNRSVEAVRDKLLLGFPCKDGSLPVGGANLNDCGADQLAAVAFGVSELRYPLAGVFEWTAASMTPNELRPWNSGMRAALQAPAAPAGQSNGAAAAAAAAAYRAPPPPPASEAPKRAPASAGASALPAPPPLASLAGRVLDAMPYSSTRMV
jgi:chitinase